MDRYAVLRITRKYISEEAVNSIRKRGLKIYAFDFLKSVTVSAILLVCLMTAGSRTPFLSPAKQPVGFYTLFVMSVILPATYWKLYRIFTRNDFKGKITSVKNIRDVGRKDVREEGRITLGGSGQLITIDNYTIVVTKGKNINYKFDFLRGKANFARDYFSVGDEIFYPAFAKYPINLSRYPKHPFCISCGYIGADNQKMCPECSIDFAFMDPIKAKKNMQ